VADGDGAAIDVQLRAVERAEGAIEAEVLLAVFHALPRGEAAEHLRREGLVDLGRVDVVPREPVAHQERRDGVHGPRPISAGSSAPQWVSTMRPSGCNPYSRTTSPEARMSIAAPSVTCELLPAVTLP